MRIKFLILLLSLGLSQVSYSLPIRKSACQIVFKSLEDHHKKINNLSSKEVSNMPPNEKIELEGKTLQFFTPLADLLGMHEVKKEMENKVFQFFHPEEYRYLKKKIKHLSKDKEAYIDEVIGFIGENLKRNGILKFDITGRYKNLYSIHRKMRDQNLPFKKIYDIIAFRILVETKDEAYKALNVIHELRDPIPEQFDDYIAHPKSNGYQSLHTTVLSSKGRNVEIQIRTYEMHEFAENGQASHWVYKNKDYQDYIKQSGEFFQWIWKQSIEMSLEAQRQGVSAYWLFLESPSSLFFGLNKEFGVKKEEDTLKITGSDSV